jgi:hypothetical protein
MSSSQNFESDKGSHEFNIHLEDTADLTFRAGDKNGQGSTRMAIIRDSAELAIGGDGHTGQLQLKNAVGSGTVFIGESGDETRILLGAGLPGRVQLHDSSGATTVDLSGATGALFLGAEDVDGDVIVRNGAGTTRIQLDGDSGQLQLFSAALFGAASVKLASLGGDTGRLQLFEGDVVTADLRGDAGILTLGGANKTDGNLFLLDSTGNPTITCTGQTGEIDCTTLRESSDERLKTGIAPLRHALDSVLALRGVCYRRDRSAGEGGEQQIGFVGQEVEAVYPELVGVDADGYRSVNYTRMTAVLVEAVKEQQRLIREQAAALSDAMRRIAALEAGPGTAAEAP